MLIFHNLILLGGSSFLTVTPGVRFAGGESGDGARVCDYDWVLDIREQCRRTGVAFHFKQTGLHFRKDGHLYTIPRPLQQPQAQKAGIDLEASPDAPCQN